jgi:hypothetical protein
MIAKDRADFPVSPGTACSSSIEPTYRGATIVSTTWLIMNLKLVIARSEATKQSMARQAEKWIASLRSQ